MDTWGYLFTTLRAAPYGTLYPASKSPVTYDVTIAKIAYAIAILLIAVSIAVIGKRKGQKVFCFIRSFVAVVILGAIMLCNYGQSWETASLVTRTPYRVGLGRHINASLSVSIGLRSINITLTGIPEVQNLTKSTSETINYNERFSWDDYGWPQGLHGFGPYAGQLPTQFRAGQYRGTPLPILWVAEYFVVDGEGIRWGRFYRQAGYYTHMAVWLAVPLWLLALVLAGIVPSYGALYAILTGVDLVGACVLYTWIRNPITLSIPFEGGRLVFSWGWCYWLTVVTGLLCFLLGVTVYVADIHVPEEVSIFFGGDVTDSFEEFYATDIELSRLQDDKGGVTLAGRITSLADVPDCPPPTPGLPDALEDSPTPSLLDESFIIPAEEEGEGLEDDEQEDDDDLCGGGVTTNTEYRQAFRKKSRGAAALTLLKHTARLRQRLQSPRSKVKPHHHNQQDPPQSQSEYFNSAPAHTTEGYTGTTTIPSCDELGHSIGELYPYPNFPQTHPTISTTIPTISTTTAQPDLLYPWDKPRDSQFGQERRDTRSHLEPLHYKSNSR